MTYQELYEKLQKEYSEASQVYLKMDTELSQINGFGAMDSLPKYAQAKSDWQVATNNYWNFLAMVKKNGIDPNGEVSLN